jgi:RsmE family RNA methyltransferase
MNLVLLTEADFVGSAGRVRIGGRRLEHILGVQRVGIGDELRVGVLNGKVGLGRVTDIAPGAISMDVVLDKEPPPALPLTLLMALPRPKVMRRVVQCATAMGIKRIYLMRTWRVEKSYWQSPLVSPEALHEQALLGLEQGQDTVLPSIELRPLFKPFVEDEIPALIGGSTALVAHPYTSQACPRGVAGPVALALGPEGGFIQFEIDLLTKAGFTAVSLGSRTLRVEDALPVLLGRLF